MRSLMPVLTLAVGAALAAAAPSGSRPTDDEKWVPLFNGRDLTGWTPKIKGYAATTPARLKVLPELPTLDESGLKGFEVSAWHAMWAPKGIPADATGRLVNALQIALKDEKVIARFGDLGTEPVPQELATPAALKKQLASEIAKWGPVIKAAGVKGN